MIIGTNKYKDLFLKEWGGLLKQYRFDQTIETLNSISVTNKKCRLVFEIRHRGYPTILFSKPLESPEEFGFKDVLKFAGPAPEDIIEPDIPAPHDDYDFDSFCFHVRRQKALTSAYLYHVLEGDFTWSPKASRYVARRKKLTPKVHQLPRDHPAKVAYRNGDLKWMDILEKELKEGK